MKLYLIRHGTTSWNARRRIQGRTDIPLDEAGEAIARITGEALLRQGVHFGRVFSSPLMRAMRTAELCAPGIPVLTDPRLTELSFGSFEGETVDTLLQDPACPFRYFRNDPVRYDEAVTALAAARPGDRFESLSALCLRAASFLEEVIEPLVRTEPSGSTLLISGHGALNQAMMMTVASKKDLRSFWGKGLQSNCGMYLIDAVPDERGKVCYHTDETCRIFYDPDALPPIPDLL